MSESNTVLCDHCNTEITHACSEHHLRIRLIEEGRTGAISPVNYELPSAIMNFCNKAHLKEWLDQ